MWQRNGFVLFLSQAFTQGSWQLYSGDRRKVLVWDADFKCSNSDASRSTANSSCTGKIMRTSDYTNISGGPSNSERTTPVKTVKPKLVMQGHLNTVWDSCFAHIGKPGIY